MSSERPTNTVLAYYKSDHADLAHDALTLLGEGVEFQVATSQEEFLEALDKFDPAIVLAHYNVLRPTNGRNNPLNDRKVVITHPIGEQKEINHADYTIPLDVMAVLNTITALTSTKFQPKKRVTQSSPTVNLQVDSVIRKSSKLESHGHHPMLSSYFSGLIRRLTPSKQAT